jgi:hypothetical protein
MEQMKNQALIADLKAALLSAQEGQTVQAEAMTDHIRERSYEVELRLAGYMIRSACGAIDGVLRSMDLDNSVAFALHEIEKLERVVRQLSPQSTAA